MNFNDDYNNSEFASAIESIKSALYDITSTITVKIANLNDEDDEDTVKFKEELNNRLMNIIKSSNDILNDISAVDKYIDYGELVDEDNDIIEDSEEETTDEEVDLHNKNMDHIETDDEEEEAEEEEDTPTEEKEKPKDDSDLNAKLDAIIASYGKDDESSNEEETEEEETEEGTEEDDEEITEEAESSEDEEEEEEAESSEDEEEEEEAEPSEGEEEATEEVESSEDETSDNEEETSGESDTSEEVNVPDIDTKNDTPVIEEDTSADTPKDDIKVSFTVNKDNKDLPKAILVTAKQYEKLLGSLSGQKALCKFRNLLTTTSELSDDVNLEDLMNQANDLYKNGDIKGAEEIYNKISEINANKNGNN